jgi:LMBR1 domain-containing protein 1
VAVVFCVVLGIMYAFLRMANIPVVRYAQTMDFLYDIGIAPAATPAIPGIPDGTPVINPTLTPSGYNTAGNCDPDKSLPGCVISKFTWQIPVSFPLYVVAFMAFLGWWFFTIFAGVGFIALPLDLFNEFRTRPEPMTTKTYFDERALLGSRTKTLLEIANKLSLEMEKKHTGSLKRQEVRDMRNLEKHYFYLKKDFQILTIAYKLRGGNPLVYFLKLFGAVVFGGVSLSWWIHIAIYILPAKPVDPFLNTFFVTLTKNVPSFPLFGVLAFALWSFHLLFCVVKGNFRLGVRFLVFKLYPMEVGNVSRKQGNIGEERSLMSCAWGQSR